MAVETDLKSVDGLLDELKQNQEQAHLSVQKQAELLNRLKIFGRSERTASPLFAPQSLATLSYYAFQPADDESSKDALRCIANALLLDAPARQTFVNQGHVSKLLESLRSRDNEIKSFCCRILLFLTYKTDLDFAELVAKQGLAEALNNIFENCADVSVKGPGNKAGSDNLLNEALTVTFNITHLFSGTATSFTAAVEPLTTILLSHAVPAPPLEPPVAALINLLMNLDLEAAALASKQAEEDVIAKAHALVDRLVEIFDKSTISYPGKKLETIASPLCILLRIVCEMADKDLRNYMKQLMLPQDEDRDKPLGQGNSLPARLLRLTVSTGLSTLRESISNLLFELSDKDADQFVHNVGYGFASGFLLSHGIAVPADQATGTVGQVEGSAPVNPITGQRLSTETTEASALDEMTEEEKEREAERLFVLFERLKATGVVDVKNPVERLYQGD